MRRADGGPPPDLVLVGAGLLGGAVAYLDLLGTDPTPWGDVSLFSLVAVLAFVVPAGVVLRRRYAWWVRKPSWARWPDVMLGAAGVALASSVVARLIGEGSVLGLVAAVLASGAIAYGASRVRP